MKYNKGTKYSVKYINIDGKEITKEITPEKEMSKPEMIMKLKETDTKFYKLLESKLMKEKFELMEDVDSVKYDENLLDYLFLELEVDTKNNDIEYIPDYEDVTNWYSDEISEDVYNATVTHLESLIKIAKFYNSDNEIYLELNDNHTIWEIEAEFDSELYQSILDKYLAKFEETTNVRLLTLGRSGRHICVELNLANLERYEELKATQEKYEKEFIDEMNNL